MSTIIGASAAAAGATASTVASTAGQTSAIAMATAILSSNKYLLGLMILLINLGARYIGSELTEFQHKVLNHKFARRFLIFLVIWMGTRDIVVALVLTACFIILVNGLFNEHSRFCILPKKPNKCNITPDEYGIAKQVVEKYEKEHSPGQMPGLMGFPPVPGSSAPASSYPMLQPTQSQMNAIAPKPSPNTTGNTTGNTQLNNSQPIQQHTNQKQPINNNSKQLEMLNPRSYYMPVLPTTQPPRPFY
jgi:hypothetical protein